jgi:arylsulfatase A-like enzyme
MKEAGYSTYFAGKWHLGKEGAYPDDQGYVVNIGGCHMGAPGAYFAPYKAEKGKHNELIPGLEIAPTNEYLTDRLTDETVKFIKANKDEPFFVFLSHYAVHTPIQGKQEYTDQYKKKLKKMPASKFPEYIKEGAGQTKMRQDHPVYASMIQSVDESLGRIRKTIADLGLADDTIIIFTSDHGGLSNRGHNTRELATTNYPLRAGKGWCYEGGIRVPLIVRIPGVTKAGSVSDRVVTGTDYYPTILSMLGLPLRPRQHLDGESFYQALKGEKMGDRRAAFWHSPHSRPYSTGDFNCSVVRDGDYKLIQWYDKDKVELFNIPKDISEEKDLSASQPGKTKELLAKLRDWRKEIDAYIDPDPVKTWKKHKWNKNFDVSSMIEEHITVKHKGKI